MKLMKYKATTSSPSSDEIEISFANGEPLKVLDDTRHSEKEDGTTGQAPSNYLRPVGDSESDVATQVLSEQIAALDPTKETFQAKALYDYEADEFAGERSLVKGEIVEVVDDSCPWWLTRKEDGTFGIAPSNYMYRLGTSPGVNHLTGIKPGLPTYKVRALYAYTASEEDPSELSFFKGEIMEIRDKNHKWWIATKADGSVGIIPSNYVILTDSGRSSKL